MLQSEDSTPCERAGAASAAILARVLTTQRIRELVTTEPRTAALWTQLLDDVRAAWPEDDAAHVRTTEALRLIDSKLLLRLFDRPEELQLLEELRHGREAEVAASIEAAFELGVRVGRIW